MAVNGHHTTSTSSSRPLKAGVFAPIPTIFLAETEELDLQSFEAHIVRCANAGVAPLIAGSMGEAAHLSHAERRTLILAARTALDNAGFHGTPIIVGTGASSLRETLELTNEAAAAGADYSIVISPGYFAGALINDRAALKAFFVEVSAKSPIPVMIYNYPGASGGIDLDSDLITELAQECPNTCGVKLTCGNVGKLTRIADAVADPAFSSVYPRKNSEAPFLVLGGFIDFLVPSAFANAHGAITGLANVAPHAISQLFKLAEAAKMDLSVLPEAQRLQGIIARADFTIAKASIAGTKFLLEKMYGYGGVPRKPLSPTNPTVAKALWDHPHTQALVQLERELAGKKRA
ncbi:dihydrodipicolinate synthetase [Crepidotus variabilis]|uniref:Dihydrodipicolinate synthetase n=1 Tax=Crepidotus variabilis TaxID=179855 RepID=A0A9P6EUN1_9AGAR|nr:dihydrodipicolinate synthetase [Crepidotus variabilis]